MNARRWPLAIGIAGLAALAASVPAKPLSLVWNASPSVPLGLYRIAAIEAPRVGDMIVVRPLPPLARFMAERRYIEAGVPLVKPIAAIGGAHICRHGPDVTIDGRHAATALDTDRIGRPLPRWTGCVRLDRDQLLLIATASPAPVDATAPGAADCARHTPEAAARSGLTVDVILRVMHAESRGRLPAVSWKGAMGCMQIMPPTWTYLTRRYGLGDDPFDPRMNMIGGALYLAELARQFGFPGAYSAYNAGPGRYRRYIAQGVPLPAETIAYTAQISANAPRPNPAPSGPRWQEANLFIGRGDDRTAPGARAAPSTADEAEQPSGPSAPWLFPLAGRRDRAPETADDRP